MSKRWVVNPGYLYSEKKKSWVYVGFQKLCKLHKLKMADCIDPTDPRRKEMLETAIYSLPNQAFVYGLLEQDSLPKFTRKEFNIDEHTKSI